MSLSCDCIVASLTAAVVVTVADADVYRSMCFWDSLPSSHGGCPVYSLNHVLLNVCIFSEVNVRKSKIRKLAKDLQVFLTGSVKAIMP